ncbi:unnamed protein product [Ilex paraguariensis]|uniref:EamA domain-containing protein n=1 Tax=Ilex paraguariensis TaxID=185542 RepID=A0ABC8T063_9AQUA
MEKVVLRSFSSLAKISGAIVSISGALVVILYKGPTIVKSSSPSKLFYQQGSFQSDWIMGGILFSAEYLVVSIWYIAQAQTVKKYPAEQLVTSLYNLSVAIIALPVAYVLEPNGSTWEISTRMMVIAILIAGLFGLSFSVAFVTWTLRLKGAVYVALFTPLSIVTSAIMSMIFLGDSLYLGSVVGAIIVSFGFYVSLWGKAKEETPDLGISSSLESQSPENEDHMFYCIDVQNSVGSPIADPRLIVEGQLQGSSTSGICFGTKRQYMGNKYKNDGDSHFNCSKSLKAQTVKKYPAEQLVTSLYNLSVAIIALPVAYVLEPNGSTWEISTRMMVIAILIAGLFGLSFSVAFVTWTLRLKGAVYVALFTPLSIVTSAIMSIIFLGDSLYLGSVVGAIIVSFGFYVSLWGKAKEETPDLGISSSLESQSPENVPLLQ